MKKITLLFLTGAFTVVSAMAQNGQLTRTITPDKVAVTVELKNQENNKILPNWEQDFEGLDDFSFNFDPWTVNDVDGGATYGINGYSFPNSESPMAFIVFNPANTTPSLGADAALQPHGGDKFGACFSAVESVNDDWLISPQIILDSNFCISFWVKSYTDEYGLEKYKVAVSTTTNEPDSFTVISGADPLLAPAGAWEEVSFNLSDYDNDTVFVAINCVSEDAFIFMVDDIIIETETGISENNEISVRIYPNPVSDYLNVEADKKISELILINSTGQIVKSKYFNNRSITLNVSGLQKGIYVLQIRTREGAAFRKIQIR